VRFDGDDDFWRVAERNKGRLLHTAFIEGREGSEMEAEATIENVSATAARISVRARCPAPSCFLRIARTNDVNWSVRVDGRPTAAPTVDISLIGVPIPAGTHSVRLSYSDPLVVEGAVVSILSLTLGAVFFLFSVRRARSATIR
jgi:hypothetical protein